MSTPKIKIVEVRDAGNCLQVAFKFDFELPKGRESKINVPHGTSKESIRTRLKAHYVRVKKEVDVVAIDYSDMKDEEINTLV